MKTGWYKGYNPGLDRLTKLLGNSKPSHGYTISEDAPEIVTAPGVYFPAEKGEVIPLKPRRGGGEVSPSLNKDSDRAKLEMVHSILSKVNPDGLERQAIKGLAISPESMKIEKSKYDIMKSALSILKSVKVAGGDREPKQIKTIPRQSGGDVTPSIPTRDPEDLWENKQASDWGPGASRIVGGQRVEWKEGMETPFAINSSPTSVSPSPTSPMSASALQNKTYGLKGGIGPNVSRGTPSPGVSPTPIQNMVQPQPDLYDRLKSASGSFDMTSTSPLDKVGEYLRQLTTMFSRANGGAVVPPEDTEEELKRLRRAMTVGGTTSEDEEMALAGVSERPTYPLTPEQLELSEREKWATPGVPEGILATTKKTLGPNVVSVTPGFQRSYYEAHPEERLIGQIDETNKPSMDVTQKLLNDARSRAQGFGLIGLGPKEAALARIQAGKDVESLTQSMLTSGASTAQTKGRIFGDITREPRTTAPRLVQTGTGEYVWATPGGVLPAGIMGKPTPPRSVTNEELVRGDLRNQLNREPTEGEVLNEIDRRKLNLQMGGIPPMSPESARVPTMAGVKNEVALEGLTPEQQSVVKKLASYELPIPGSFAMKDPKWQALLGRTAAYDSSFDATQYAVRQKLRQDFTSGKAANNIRSLNTAIGHLDTLSTKANALSNAPIQIWNAIKNKGLTATGDKRVTEFNAAATAVESELANVFKGMGASDQEIKAWRQNLSTSQSPEQLKGAIDTAIELLEGRLGALQSQYETGLGRPKDFRFLSDKSRSILKKLGANVDVLDMIAEAQESSSPEIKGGFPKTPSRTKDIKSMSNEDLLKELEK